MKKITFIITLLYLVACGSDDDNTGPARGDNFDRQAMLINWADNIIIPVFEDLDAKLDELSAAKNDFVDGPNLAKLEALRSTWLEAYKVWQYAEMFNVGKAESLNYRFFMNVYPTNKADIENNIQLNTYDLRHPNNSDAVGFPALDYLLYGLSEDDTEQLSYYIDKPAAAERMNYLSNLVYEMSKLTKVVLTDWKGSFRDEFVSSFDNTATSSVNEHTNDFIFYYEKVFRANKFGIPAGVFSNAPLAEKVEAFYKGDVSKVLAQEAFLAVRDFFSGKAYDTGENGSGYDDYLLFLNTVSDGENLSALINNQFNMVDQKIGSLDDSFYHQIFNDNTSMLQTYDEIQRAVVYLKVDMLQAFDISVDFADADGD